MQKRVSKSLDTFMADVKEAGTAASIESPPRTVQSAWVTRTRVVLISEELGVEEQ